MTILCLANRSGMQAAQPSNPGGGQASSPHQRRDYFVAEDPEGARYWIYRERETGDGWFLHGLFA